MNSDGEIIIDQSRSMTPGRWRAIVFNGDVMNTAARLEELSRKVEGGFLASRAAMERFSSAPPFAVRDLGRIAIRGRAHGIDILGLDTSTIRPPGVRPLGLSE